MLDEEATASGHAEVVVTEPTGSDAVVYLEAENEYSVTTPRENVPDRGTTISYTIPSEKIHLFDPRTKETVYHGPAKRRDDATKVAGDVPP
jgi:ABC-type sugar transport system ATPase subunit